MEIPKRNPFKKKAIQIAVLLAASVALIVQPWQLLLRILGVVLLIHCIPLLATHASYARKWREMLEHPLLETQEGIVFEGGAMQGGEMHFLRIHGCRVEACTYEDGLFSLTYSFAKKKERSDVSLSLPVPPEKEEDALAAAAYYKDWIR